eukprot:scaffold8747_cov96-Cylindrotheca_fusiformis.AAC.11
MSAHSEYDSEDSDDPYAYLNRRDQSSSSSLSSSAFEPQGNATPEDNYRQVQPSPSQQKQNLPTTPAELHSAVSTIPEEEEVGVCCGCRPKRDKSSTKWKRQKKVSRFKLFSSSTQFYDAQEQMPPPSHSRNSSFDVSDSSSLYYFDAVETPLGEDEYPPFFTTSIVHPKPKVTLEDPTTMLKHAPNDALMKTEGNEAEDEVHPKKPISSHMRRSVRFEKITRRPTIEHAQALRQPRVAQNEKGYPGGLTSSELEECKKKSPSPHPLYMCPMSNQQKFLRGLKQLDPGVMDQVYSFRDVEEEPYTICRWLRATKFKADAILERLEENQPLFERAQKHDFYPDPTQTLGAPVSVFLSQYPFLPMGWAKNGCPVNYFMAGQINPEGIMCLTTIEQLEGYFWWSFMWKMKDEIRRAQEADPDFVRMEGINIVDLKGLSSSALTSETMEVIKVSSKVADFFPETLHCMLILNAPGFFSFSWTVIKKFLDARTAARIQVFSSEEKGLQALRALIGSEEIPQDYGGQNISIQQAFAKQASDPSLVRQDVQLVHVKKGKKQMARNTWKLQGGEVMTINVYTRSVSGACVIAYVNNQVLATAEAACTFNRDGKPLPNCVRLANINFAGNVTLEVQDLDNASRAHSGQTRGYFLIVGDVKQESSQLVGLGV